MLDSITNSKTILTRINLSWRCRYNVVKSTLIYKHRSKCNGTTCIPGKLVTNEGAYMLSGMALRLKGNKPVALNPF
jgi:hypothetical protein